ncbi:uncharacterized protein LOC120017164 [Tripterygium wilfordii]|uniref:uncharacterized protein LOC120017164 n=1 Tax=Tripterygium wilfordii TaxID=458696 RepID=UPI0018F7F606|nr:uncharacterized protein LOC120017164 [Tripterygium wilfordii]
MQGGNGGRDPFSGFGGPFAGLGGFGSFGSQRSLMSSFFGGRDPFDDPFFSRPFGGMLESNFFGSGGSPFPFMQPPAFLEHQAAEPMTSRGPIIEEINSDGEKEEADNKKKEKPRKHARSSNEPFVEVPDDEAEGRRNRHMQLSNDFNRISSTESQPQVRSFTFQSSTVTYGGVDGAYQSSSKMRRTGSDGVTFEESKEADSATRQASHRLSRGLHNKGHTVMRKLKSDGRVDTMQTLHNLNEGEVAGFEEAWEGNARKHLPGWMANAGSHDTAGVSGLGSQGGRALPSMERSGNMITYDRNIAGSSHSEHLGKTNYNQGSRDNSGNPRGRRKH